MSRKHTVIYVIGGLALCIAAISVGLLVYGFVKRVQGVTRTGMISSLRALPYVDNRLDGLPVSGDIQYYYHESLSQILVYFTASADPDAVSDFLTSEGWMAFVYSDAEFYDTFHDWPERDVDMSPFQFSASTQDEVYYPPIREPSVIYILCLSKERRLLVKIFHIKRM